MSQEYKDQDSDNKSKDYRLVVLRAENLQEVRSIDLSVSKIYVFISSVILLIVILLISLIVFTPLRKLIPGYGKIEANEHFIQLVQGVDQLENSMQAQELYLGALRKLITSNGDTSQGQELSLVVNELSLETDTHSTEDINQNYHAPPAREIQLSSDDDALWKTIAKNAPKAPLEGLISAEFDPGAKHFGVDILAPSNTAVRSILDGYVISSGWDLETGYTIGVQHKGEIISFYKHNSILLKEKGTFVSAGEAVAIIGNTGTLSSGPHLHFEFWHHGKPINPKDIINFN
ncbi:MAG: murein DD-endopeptidase MepM/ murein hydrolase activator NlpD [Saprospiraceae bacterium]|jgi:murein DD-endopeptidase MepM/ murein hydrolase activator NlpD